jgi:hypothetical protein
MNRAIPRPSSSIRVPREPNGCRLAATRAEQLLHVGLGRTTVDAGSASPSRAGTSSGGASAVAPSALLFAFAIGRLLRRSADMIAPASNEREPRSTIH